MRVGSLSAWLTISPLEGNAARPDYLQAGITGSGMSASLSVYSGWTAGLRDLVDFFDSMTRDWRG